MSNAMSNVSSAIRSKNKATVRSGPRKLSQRSKLVVGLAASMVSISGIESRAATGTSTVKIKSVNKGSASVLQSGPNTVISVANRTIIDFSQFDLAKGQSVRFIEPSSKSILLDEVQSLSASQINGKITSNGSVLFVNANGIVFGKDAVITSPNFIAAAGTLSDSNFLSGHYDISLTGSVLNQGQINSAHTALVGQIVNNQGTISTPAGSIVMVAGSDVLLGSADSGVYVNLKGAAPASGTLISTGVTNTGTLDAGSGKVSIGAGDMYSMAMRIGGTVKASQIAAVSPGNVTVTGKLDASNTAAGGKGGTIQVTGKQLILQGATVNASGAAGGGQINIGGGLHGSGTLAHAQTTYIDSATTINANATTTGNGGQVTVWSDTATGFYGNVTASGGSAGGNGGSTEVSSHGYLEYRGWVGLSALHGTGGKLLLDPADVTLVTGNTATTNLFDGSGNFSGGDTNPSTIEIGSGAVPAAGTLLRQLDLGSVSIFSTGQINVQGPITFATPGTLTLTATSNLNLNSTISSTGVGAINLTSIGGNIVIATGAGIASGGNITLTAASAGGTVSIADGDAISTTGTAAIIIKASNFANGTAGNPTSGGTLTTVGGDILIQADTMDLGSKAGILSTGSAAPGQLTLEPLTASRNIELETMTPTSAVLSLTTANLGAISSGFKLIKIGAASGTGTITTGDQVTFDSPVTFLSPSVTLGGDVLTTGGAITFGSTTSNCNVTLTTSVNFDTTKGAFSTGANVTVYGNITGTNGATGDSLTIKAGTGGPGSVVDIEGTTDLNNTGGPGGSLSITAPAVVLHSVTTNGSTTGTAGTATVSGANSLTLFEGGSGAYAISKIQADSIMFPGGLSSLTINHTGTSAQMFTLDNVTAPLAATLLINGNSAGTDTVTVNDGGSKTLGISNATPGTTTISYPPTAPTQTLSFTSINSLTLAGGGSDNVTINVLLNSTLPSLTFMGGTGNTVALSATTTAAANNISFTSSGNTQATTLTQIAGATVSKSITVMDTPTANYSATLNLNNTGNNVVGIPYNGVNPNVTINNPTTTDSLVVVDSVGNLAPITINGTSVGTYMFTGPSTFGKIGFETLVGGDTVNVTNLTVPTTVDFAAGTNTVNIALAAGSKGSLTVNGASGHDTANITSTTSVTATDTVALDLKGGTYAITYGSIAEPVVITDSSTNATGTLNLTGTTTGGDMVGISAGAISFTSGGATPNAQAAVTLTGIGNLKLTETAGHNSVAVILGGLPKNITLDPVTGDILTVYGTAGNDTLGISAQTINFDNSATVISYDTSHVFAALNVYGMNGNDTVSITGTSAPATVFFGGTPVAPVSTGDDGITVLLGNLGGVTVNGGTGSDTLTVSSPGGADTLSVDLADVTERTQVVNFANPFVQLNVNSVGHGQTINLNAASTNTTITAGLGTSAAVDGNNTINVNGTTGHTGPVAISILGGDGDDTLNVYAVDSNLTAPLYANLGSGNNTYHVFYNYGSGSIAGPLNFVDSGGNGTLIVTGTAVGGDTIAVEPSVGGVNPENLLFSGQQPVTFTGMQQLHIIEVPGNPTSNSIDLVTQNLPSSVTVNGGSAHDTLEVDAIGNGDVTTITATAVTADGKTINYTNIAALYPVQVAPGLSGANNIVNVYFGGLPVVTLNGNGPTTLNAYGLDPGNDTIGVSVTQLTDGSDVINYTNVNQLNVFSRGGSDTVNVTGLANSTAITVGNAASGDGDDTVNIISTYGHGGAVALSITGGNGADTLNIDQTDATAAVTANLGAGVNVYNLNYGFTSTSAIAGPVTITDAGGAAKLNVFGTQLGRDSINVSGGVLTLANSGAPAPGESTAGVTFSGITALSITETTQQNFINLVLHNLPATTVTGSGTDTLSVGASGGGDVLAIHNTSLTGDGTSVVYTGISTLNQYYVGGGATTATNPNIIDVYLGGYTTVLNLNGGTGPTYLKVYGTDSTGAAPSGNDTIAISDTQLTDSLINGAASGDVVNYSSFSQLYLYTLGGTDSVTLTGTAAGTSLYSINVGNKAAGDGNDTIAIIGTVGNAAGVTVSVTGGNGADMLNIQQSGGSATLIADLGNGGNTYNVQYNFGGTISGPISIQDTGTGSTSGNTLNFIAGALNDSFEIKLSSGSTDLWLHNSTTPTPLQTFSGINTVNFSGVGPGGSVTVDLGGLPAIVNDMGVGGAGALVVNDGISDTITVSGASVVGDGTTVSYIGIGTLAVNNGSVFTITGTSVPTTVTGGTGTDTMTVTLAGLDAPLTVDGGSVSTSNTLILNSANGDVLIQLADGTSSIGSDVISSTTNLFQNVTASNFGQLTVNGIAPSNVTVQTTNNLTGNTNTLGLTGTGTNNTLTATWEDTQAYSQTVTTSGFQMYTLTTQGGIYNTTVNSTGTNPTTLNLGGGTNTVGFAFPTIGSGTFTVAGMGGNETINGTGFSGTTTITSASVVTTAGGSLNYSDITTLNLDGTTGALLVSSSAAGTTTNITLGSEDDMTTVTLGGLAGPVNLVGGGGADTLIANGSGDTTLSPTVIQQGNLGALTYTGGLQTLNVVLSSGNLSSSGATTAGTVTLETDGGSITSAVATPTLTTGTLFLNASGSIGAGAAAPLYTTVSTLSTAPDAVNGVTAGSGIAINNTGPVGGTVMVTGLFTPAALSLVSSNSISLTPLGGSPAVSGSSVTLNAVAGSITSSGAVLSVQGDTILLTASGNVGTDAIPIQTASLSGSAADTISGSAGSDGFYIYQDSATGLGIGNITATSQIVNLTLTGGALTSSTGTTIIADTLNAYAPGGMMLNTAVITLLNLTSANTSLPHTELMTGDITITQANGGTPGVMVQAATAGNVTIGTDQSLGILTIGAGATKTVTLTAVGSILSAGDATATNITAANLVATAGTAISLNTAVSSITATVAGPITSASNGIAFQQSGPVTLTSINSNGNFSIGSTGTVTVNTVIAAGNVLIVTPQQVVTGAGVIAPNVTATSLDIEQASGVNLSTNISLLTANLAAGSALSIQQSTSPLTLASVNDPAGTVIIGSSGGDIIIDSLTTGSTAGSVQLTASGNVVNGLTTGAAVITTPTLTVSAAQVGPGATVLNTDISTLNVTMAPDVNLNNVGALTVSTLGSTGGNVTITTATGDLTLASNALGTNIPLTISLTAGGGSKVSEEDATITAGTSITFGSAVELTGVTTLMAPSITFGGSLMSDAGLTLTAAGAPGSATFTGPATFAGTTTISADDAVMFSSTANMTGPASVTAPAVTFVGSLNAGSTLNVSASGSAAFNSAVSVTGATTLSGGTATFGGLASLMGPVTLTSSNVTFSNGLNALSTVTETSTGSATFNGPVTFTGAATLTAPTITFNGPLTAKSDLTVSATNSATFNGSTGLFGTTNISAGSASTSGKVLFAGASNLGSGTTTVNVTKFATLGSTTFSGDVSGAGYTLLINNLDASGGAVQLGNVKNYSVLAVGNEADNLSGHPDSTITLGLGGTPTLGDYQIVSLMPAAGKFTTGKTAFYGNVLLEGNSVTVEDNSNAGFGVIFGGSINGDLHASALPSLTVTVAGPLSKAQATAAGNVLLASDPPRIYLAGDIGTANTNNTRVATIKNLTLGGNLSSPASTATILSGLYKFGSTSDPTQQIGTAQLRSLNITTAGSFTMGQNQKFVVSGALDIDAGTASAAAVATLDDIYALGSLTVNAPSFTIYTRPSSATDLGVTFASSGTNSSISGFGESGHQVHLSSSNPVNFVDAKGTDLPYNLLGSGAAESNVQIYYFSTALNPGALSNVNAVMGSSGSQVTESAILNYFGVANKSGFDPHEVVGLLPAQLPLIALDAGVAGSAVKELEELGVNSKENKFLLLELFDKMESGRGIYNDYELHAQLPLVSPDRLGSGAVNQVIDTFRKIYCTDGNGKLMYADDASGLRLPVPQYPRLHELLLNALNRCVADAKARQNQPVQPRDIAGPQFRAYLEKSKKPEDAAALNLLNQLAGLRKQISLMGLTSNELQVSYDFIYKRIKPTSWEGTQMDEAVAPPGSK